MFKECPFLNRNLPKIFVFVVAAACLAGCGRSAASFIAKGNEYLQKRKFHDAVMQFRSAVEADESSAEAHWGLARSYEGLGQFSETLEALRKSVELDGTNLEAKARLGNYFLLMQTPLVGETEKLRDEILSSDPNFIEGHLLTAAIMAAQGKPESDIVRAVNAAIDRDRTRVQSYISLHRLYLTREKPVEAEQAIKRGIDANPASELGYMEYGRFLMYASRDAEAEKQFAIAIEKAPHSTEPREAAAEFYETSRQLERAEAMHKELVVMQEYSPESRLVMADFYSRTGRINRAIEVLDEVLAGAPDYALARYRLGDIHLKRRDVAKVNEQLEALLKLNDDDVEALKLRARLRIFQGDSEQAVGDLQEILKKQPSGREPLFLMAEAKLNLGQIDQANAFVSDLERYHPNYLRSGLLRIQSSFAAGELPIVIKTSGDLLTKIASTQPNVDNTASELEDLRVRALTSRGLAQLELGNIAAAKPDLQAVVAATPRSSAAAVNLAKAFAAERNLGEARNWYEKALSLDPESFDALNGIVATDVRTRSFDRAHSRVDQSIAASAGKPAFLAAAHYLKSTIFTAQQNAAAAEAELSKALAIDPNYLPAYSAYAGMLVAQNRVEEAIAKYKSIVEKSPSPPIYTMIGILEDSRGNTNAAERAYRSALEITPDNAIAANNLAWIIAESNGNLDEALQLARTAVMKNPKAADLYDTLGWIYLKKGLATPAVEQFKKALAAEQASGTPTNPGYRLRLGMALAKTGDKASARRELETSLRYTDALSPRDRADARNALASL